MLVKNRDRLTIDAVLSLQSYLENKSEAAFDEFLNLVRSQRRGSDQLSFGPLAKQDVVFEMHHPDRKIERLSFENFTLRLGSTLRLITPVSSWRFQPEEFETFLTGDASHALAFDMNPLIVGVSDAGLSLIAFEGRSGRVYRRSPAEIVEALRSFPHQASVFSDIEMMTEFRASIQSLADLEQFLAEQPDRHADFVLQTISMAAGAYFDEGDEGQKAKSYILELNPNAKATLNIAIARYPETLPGFIVDRNRGEEQLRKALEAICKFADEKGIGSEAGAFKNALEILDPQTPVSRLPIWQKAGRTEEEFRLFRAAISADDFAGMGSWNDVQIDQDEKFRRLSNGLVLSLLEAICGACEPRRS
jgi:hypothetical protein